MTWKEAIIEVMRTRPARDWPLQDIYRAMERHPVVKTYHGEAWKSGGQARSQCWIRRALTNLVREGFVARVHPATYRLTSN